MRIRDSPFGKLPMALAGRGSAPLCRRDDVPKRRRMDAAARSLQPSQIQLTGCLAVVVGPAFFAWFARVNQGSTKSPATTNTATVYETVVAPGLTFPNWSRTARGATWPGRPGPATFAGGPQLLAATLVVCASRAVSTPGSDLSGECWWGKALHELHAVR